jgi:DNA (cytosine-5)-methyltransferase 1
MNEPKKFRHGSLFSGIGGFDLAAEWMGWENVFHCEWNPFGQRILKHYWPNAESFEDITKTDFTNHYGTIDLISGGFPCQPYSAAGKRLGKADERHLWPHMLRAIAEIAPRYVVGENVRGITNWNRGMVFDEVCVDLENLGYSVAPFIIPASAVNAPHQRERVWFVAYNFTRRIEEMCQWSGNKNKPVNATNASRMGLWHSTTSREISSTKTNAERQGCKSALFIKTNDNGYKSDWVNFPTQSPICGRDDGFSNELDGITFSKWRNESIRAYGNAVVPNLVFEIFKAIEAHEQQQQQTKIQWP